MHKPLQPWLRIWGAAGLSCLGLIAPASAGPLLTNSAAPEERLAPGQLPADPALQMSGELREPYDPFFDVDWSLGLRGTYTTGSTGDRFETRVLPAFTLNHLGSRSTVAISGDAEVVRGEEGEIDVSGLRLGLDGGYALDSVTTVSTTADFALSQDIVGTPGIASDVLEAPRNWQASAGATVERQFGLFNVAVSAVVARNAYGETRLIDGSTRDDSDQNYWSTDGTLRVGYQATPIFEVFGEAGMGRDSFDSASAANSADATDTTLRAGVSGNWNERLLASASTGLAFRRFDAESLDSLRTQVYDASLTYALDPTLALKAGFTTTVAPPGPDASGTARVEYEATAEANYTINSWLALRAGAAWSYAEYTGSNDTADGYGFSAGADYQVNSRAAINADYDYAYSDSQNAGVQDAHRISLGLTVSR